MPDPTAEDPNADAPAPALAEDVEDEPQAEQPAWPADDDVDYKQQSEEDLRRMLDEAREQGRKLTSEGRKPQTTPEERGEKEEARKREAARKEKVLVRLAQKVDITFADLFDLGLGKPAAGCTLRCEVVRKVMEHWPNSKQVRVMDSNGDIRSAFFYTDENPYFDLEEARESMVFTFKEPYLHYFMDGQTGLRVENAKNVKLEANRGWSTSRRFDYALAEKEDGTRWVKQKKWDEAYNRYSNALELLTSAPTTDPAVAAQRPEVEKNLYLNLALVLLAKDSFEETIKLCRKALEIDPHLPKAYFRMGQAQAKDRQFEQAETSFLKALEYEPNDKMIKDALRNLRGSLRERKEAETQLWKGKIQKEPTKGPEERPPGEGPVEGESSRKAAPAPTSKLSAIKFNSLLLSAAGVAVLAVLLAILYAALGRQ
eukprot:GGOE01004371.1.p1 GENE.GGOE01004371.1~~GGOE01004371.1.p1  ORF type:complete len:428 (+),score=162.71 GGOE01004371.1:36-1319(+)